MLEVPICFFYPFQDPRHPIPPHARIPHLLRPKPPKKIRDRRNGRPFKIQHPILPGMLSDAGIEQKVHGVELFTFWRTGAEDVDEAIMALEEEAGNGEFAS